MAEKVPNEVLEQRMQQCPKSGTRWKHYKTGNVYVVMGSAILESTREALVLYRPETEVYLTFARPLGEWDEEVSLIEGGRTIPRFSKA